MQIEKEETAFNFEEFKNQAIAYMKVGKVLVGKDGIFAPLMKEFLETTLEDEMNAHKALILFAERPRDFCHTNSRLVKRLKINLHI